MVEVVAVFVDSVIQAELTMTDFVVVVEYNYYLDRDSGFVVAAEPVIVCPVALVVVAVIGEQVRQW